jgi:hypothetical protein
MSIIPPNVETIIIAISRGRTGVEQPVLGLSPSAVCSTAARGSAISRGRTGVEQPVLGSLPVPSVLRRHWAAPPVPRRRGAAQSAGAAPA